MKRIAVALAVCAMMSGLTDSRLLAQEGREDPAGVVAYLSQVRGQAGLVPFQHNAHLDQSARNHAAYLSRNHAEGHGEAQGNPGFTGAKPHERMRTAGYTTSPVGENVSNGSLDARHAVDSLMSAIYHRLGFLSFDMDEAGIGSAPGPEGKRIYVFNMGSSESASTEFCKHPDPSALLAGPGHYYEMCAARLKVKPEVFDTLQSAAARRNPRIVVWPSRQARDIPVTFSGERPNPLPDRAVSGYPVSVQFNPALIKSARLTTFRLFAVTEGTTTDSSNAAARTEMSATRVLTAESDPNREMGALEFALFPLERLEWDRTYLAQARFIVDGKDEEVSWSFHTHAIGLPLYEVTGHDEELAVKPGAEYAIRVAPSPRQPLLGRVEYAAPGTVRIALNLEDENTLRVVVTGPLCARIRMTAGSATFTLRLALDDTISGAKVQSEIFAACPEFSADFKITGAGEELRVKPGATYRIYVQPGPAQSQVGRLHIAYPPGIEPKFELEDANTIKATVRGTSRGKVNVDLSGGRRFSLIVDPSAPGR